MKYYAVAEINIRTTDWIAEYVTATSPLVESFGGRYLSRTANLEKIEGNRPSPQLCLLIEWPSREAAMDFYESDKYRPHRERRKAGSTGDFMLVAGEDIGGVARI